MTGANLHYISDFEAVPAPDSAQERFRLRVYTAKELVAIPDPPESDFLLGPLVLRGARTIIVGDTGHGKTTLALQFNAAILLARECIGQTGQGNGPVVFIDIEQGIRSIKRGLREAGLHDQEDVIYITQPDGLELDSNKEHREELEHVLAHLQPSVVTIDPYYKAHRGDSNEERAVVDLMRYLDALRAQHHFALILPAHPRKDPASSPVRKLSLHDVSGSGAAVRGAEVILSIERLAHGFSRLRILKDRDGDLPVGDTWPLVFERGEGFKLDPKEQASEEDIENQIRSDQTGEWRTIPEWAMYLGIRETKAKTILNRMVEKEQVQFLLGPAGRSPKAKCYSTTPDLWADSGGVTESAMDGGTPPTPPDVYRDTSGVGVVAADELRRAESEQSEDDIPF